MNQLEKLAETCKKTGVFRQYLEDIQFCNLGTSETDVPCEYRTHDIITFKDTERKYIARRRCKYDGR